MEGFHNNFAPSSHNVVLSPHLNSPTMSNFTSQGTQASIPTSSPAGEVSISCFCHGVIEDVSSHECYVATALGSSSPASTYGREELLHLIQQQQLQLQQLQNQLQREALSQIPRPTSSEGEPILKLTECLSILTQCPLLLSRA